VTKQPSAERLGKRRVVVADEITGVARVFRFVNWHSDCEGIPVDNLRQLGTLTALL